MEQVNVEIKGTPIPGLGVCLECIGYYKLHINDVEKMANEEPPPDMHFAVTLAPSWQQQTLMGQMFMACVSVPSCMGHLGVAELTPAQKAAKSGLVIPGAGG